MIIGLYHNLQRLTARLHADQPTDTEPRIAHFDQVSREQTRIDREAVAATILEDEAFVADLQGLINRMTVSEHGSAHRKLAIRHLEDAQSRLLRELGDTPIGSLSKGLNPVDTVRAKREAETND